MTMKPYKRIVVNTFAQYLRTIVNTLVSLYTVRVVLNTLGENDFGIYTLIAGLVSMLSFLIASLTTTTQRFICYNQGKSDSIEIKKVFNSSLTLHIIIGLFAVTVFECVRPLFFNGFLNIPVDRNFAAQGVFHAVVIILFISFVTAPFRALIVSHENIAYISMVDIFDCFLKLCLVLVLTVVNMDKLIFYAIIMVVRQGVIFLFISAYCFRKYDECLLPRKSLMDRRLFKDQLSFAGWYVYGIGCVIGRQQGLALILNRMAGPAINAAYGIGFQLAGYTNFVSSSLANAISPQIIKAEGAGDRKKALALSNVTCKMMFFLLTMVCIPSIFEMNRILEIWLKTVPEGTTLFCSMVMVAIICDSLTIGLNYINQAIGKIKLYTILINTPKILTLPIALFLCLKGCSLTVLAYVYVFIELFCSLFRIILINRTAGLNIIVFFKDVLLKEIIPFAVLITACLTITDWFSSDYRFVMTYAISITMYIVSIYYFGLTSDERMFVGMMLSNVKKRLKK